ncbi:MAG: ATP-dependent DNA helicase RecG [Candidatus Microthrix sp.]|nr:ATP-dependent DNA helicase RecG [Candidatus Microthrix sp.]
MTTTTPLSLRDLDALAVDKLRGVGGKKRDGLAVLGIDSVLDLLFHYPRRYVDRTREARIADLRPGEEGMFLGEVERISGRRVRGGRALVEARVTDGSGSMKVTFFNQAWRERQLPTGTKAVFYGKVDEFRGARQLTNPVVDLVGDRTGRILPIYPQSEKAKLSTWELADWVAESLRRIAPRGLADPVPRRVLDALDLIDRQDAMASIHAPESMGHMVKARTRLVFDELLRVQLALVAAKAEREATVTGVVHAVGQRADQAVSPGLVDAFLASLPFPLTGAQTRAIDEILADLERRSAMHRLLQGDVGAGKTLVAVAALLAAVQGGHQGALMAPTEVLAEQHHRGIAELLDGFVVPAPDTLLGERPLHVALLTSRLSAPQRRTVLAQLASGEIDLAVGTHSLISEGVDFASLGVAVVDEQHRFGVDQRAALAEVGEGDSQPDLLVMTATPIPRTAAMTVYGDLDVSTLDELPPGRTPIVTHWAQTPLDVEAVWQTVRDEVAAGRQAYVVCPLVGESEKLEVASAEQTLEELANDQLDGLRLGLLHGRVPADEGDATMAAFRAGELDVLVATTVIEVGVDVPNATVMVILDADRFGIAQLHQLRGRVGRGAAKSSCWLVAAEPSDDGEERIKAMVKSTDGFELAEVDLELRGEGTLMGERQKGRNDLRLASLRRDREWVVRARNVAIELLAEADGLANLGGLADEVDLILGQDEVGYLMKG